MSPARRASLGQWGPGVAAWVVTCAVPTAFDTWASSRQPERPTQSRILGHFLAHPVLGPILAGVFCGLGYHLFVNEALICWQQLFDATKEIAS